jgi:hypothetical protein
MMRVFRFVTIALLVVLAVAFGAGIFYLQDWGGSIESILVIFGDKVWVSIDAGRPRIALLYLLPAVLLWAAFSLYTARRGAQ